MPGAVLSLNAGGSTAKHVWSPSAPRGRHAEHPHRETRRRTSREWLVDVLSFGIAVTVVAWNAMPAGIAWPSGFLGWLDLGVGALGCAALWLRRRWPVGVALACAPIGAFVLPTPASFSTLLVFSVAVHRPARTAFLVASPILVTSPLYYVLHPDSPLSRDRENMIFPIIFVLAVLGLGMLMRSRRQVVLSLAERAVQAESEQRLRVGQARQLERTRIAREMHDVLAHRISLVSLHAGALEYRIDAPPAEITQAAGVIRANAHQALQELREVIGVLRQGPAPEPAPEPEWPTPADPPALRAAAARRNAPALRVAPNSEQPDLEHPGSGDHGPGRTLRDWAIDLLLFALGALLVIGFSQTPSANNWTSEQLKACDLAAGTLLGLALWLRRRWPVAVALVCAPLGLFVFATGIVAALVALFTVAVRRPPRTALLVGALAVVPAPLRFLVYEYLQGDWVTFPIGITLVVGVLGWGMQIRSQRELVAALRERAAQARSQQHLRVGQVRRLERTRIARDMHDVLAHRISLVSLHAGALEYSPDTAAADITRTAGVIRTNAHQALKELREVIGVLHEGPATDPERPQPTLADLPELVAQSQIAGNPVRYRSTVTDPRAVPATTGRAVYRLAQEALTNARKHAPGSDVQLTITGIADRLHIEITNPLPATTAPSAVPGAGVGLVGLAERITLAHGQLVHGPTPQGLFRLEAWLPWPG